MGHRRVGNDAVGRMTGRSWKGDEVDIGLNLARGFLTDYVRSRIAGDPELFRATYSAALAELNPDREQGFLAGLVGATYAALEMYVSSDGDQQLEALERIHARVDQRQRP